MLWLSAGEGSQLTKFYFPNSMTDLYNNTWRFGISQWNYNGSYLLFGGSSNLDPSKYYLADVTQVSKDSGAAPK
jgi:hypothetical protein